jgi:hypothetical protein
MPELTGWNVILALKIAVAAVTLLFLASLAALLSGRYRLHGRINHVFFFLTLSALLGLEILIRLVNPRMFDYLDEAARRWLLIHLCFAVPAAVLLPVMLLTGRTRRRRVHLAVAGLFGFLWVGTFVTGIFFLPHTPP